MRQLDPQFNIWRFDITFLNQPETFIVRFNDTGFTDVADVMRLTPSGTEGQLRQAMVSGYRRSVSHQGATT